jgi:hypothetical protein
MLRKCGTGLKDTKAKKTDLSESESLMILSEIIVNYIINTLEEEIYEQSEDEQPTE